jgi:hypothetical protein
VNTLTTENYVSPIDALKLVKLDLLQAENIYYLAKSGFKEWLKAVYWNKREGLYVSPQGQEALKQCMEYQDSVINGMDALAEEINKVGAIVYDEDPGLCRGGLKPAYPPVKEDPHVRPLLEDVT